MSSHFLDTDIEKVGYMAAGTHLVCLLEKNRTLWLFGQGIEEKKREIEHEAAGQGEKQDVEAFHSLLHIHDHIASSVLDSHS